MGGLLMVAASIGFIFLFDFFLLRKKSGIGVMFSVLLFAAVIHLIIHYYPEVLILASWRSHVS